MTRRVPSEAELEAVLRGIGAELRVPEVPHLAARVRARTAEPARPARRPWLLGLAPAALTLLVIGAGATAAEVVRLRGVDVFPVPAASAPPRRPLDLGVRETLASARALPGVRTSADPVFASPDEVYVRRAPTGAQVSFVYGPRPGLPAGPSGYGALVSQLPGSFDASLIGKGLGPGASVVHTTVGASPALWIEGQAHFFFYRDPSGAIVQESLRLAGNTLLWDRGGQLMRLEAQVSRARAIEIAASFR